MCQVLMSVAVYQQVQYRVQCMPRSIFQGALLWQPMGLRGDAKDDEWMYQIKDIDGKEDSGQWSNRALEVLFQMVLVGRSETSVEAEAVSLKQKFGAKMNASDVACIDLLLTEFRSPSVSSSCFVTVTGGK
jgi:hypothetical protein